MQRQWWHMARGASILALAAGTFVCALGPLGGCAGRRAAPPGVELESGRRMDPIAVSALRERALDVLAEYASGLSPQLRANALEAMSEMPARLDRHIPAALSDESAGVRSTAAIIIGRSGLTQWGPAVRPLLHDSSAYVRISALYALVKTGADIDRSPLAAYLLADPSPRVRAHAAYLLGELGDPSALGLLKEATRAPMPRGSAAEARLLHLQIAEAMVKLGDEGQLESIRAALYPSRPEEFEATALAVQIIGHLQARAAIDELVVLTAIRDSRGSRLPAEVRLGAAGSLARLGMHQGTFLAEEFATSDLPALRAQTAHVYGEIGLASNLPRLERMLADPEGLVRVSAAAAIVKITSRPGTDHGDWQRFPHGPA